MPELHGREWHDRFFRSAPYVDQRATEVREAGVTATGKGATKEGHVPVRRSVWRGRDNRPFVPYVWRGEQLGTARAALDAAWEEDQLTHQSGMIDGNVIQPPSEEPPMMASDTSNAIRRFRALGFSVTQGGRNSHWFVHRTNGDLLTTLPSSPSDRRGHNAVKLILKRLEDEAAQQAQVKRAEKKQLAETRRTEAPMTAPSLVTAKNAYERMAAEGHLTIPSTIKGDIPVTAWWMWENIRSDAEAQNKPVSVDGTDGWHWTGMLKSLVSKLWPQVALARPGVSQSVQMNVTEYLRLTGNLRMVKPSGGGHPSTYWVRGAWKPGGESLGETRLAVTGSRVSLTTTAARKIREAILSIADSSPSNPATIRAGQLFERLDGVVDRATISSTLTALVKVDDTFPLTRQTGQGQGVYLFTKKTHHTRAVQPKETPPMPTPKTSRNPNARLDVLRWMQAHRGEVWSITEVADGAGISPGTVASNLRFWAGKGNLENRGRGLYVCPEAEETAPVTVPAPIPVPAAKVTVPAPPPVVTAPVVPAVVPAVVAQAPERKPLWVNPDAVLYEEVYRTTADDLRIIRTEDGDMIEIRIPERMRKPTS